MGIRYKHGLFEQKIVDGHQVELPEQWLKNGNVWEVRNADQAVDVPFWGEVHMTEKTGVCIFATNKLQLFPLSLMISRSSAMRLAPLIRYGFGTPSLLRTIMAAIFCLISGKQKLFLNFYILMTPMTRENFAAEAAVFLVCASLKAL